jgi:hypothetical protein
MMPPIEELAPPQIAPEVLPATVARLEGPEREKALESAVLPPDMREETARIKAIKRDFAMAINDEYREIYDGISDDGTPFNDRMLKMAMRPTTVAIEAAMLKDAKGNVIPQVVERLAALAKNAEGALSIRILVLGEETRAANVVIVDELKRIDSSIDVEFVDEAGIDRFVTEQVDKLNAEEPTLERFVVMVGAAGAETVAKSESLKSELTSEKPKAALRIIGNNLIEYGYVYGRLCSILAIPVELEPVVYMMGSDDELKGLIERLKIEGIGVIVPIDAETLREEFEASLEVERAM